MRYSAQVMLAGQPETRNVISAPGRVCALDLRGFVLGDRRHSAGLVGGHESSS